MWLSQPAPCAADGFCMVLLILLLFGRCSVVLLEEEPGKFCWNLVSSCIKEATSHATLSGHCVQCLEDEIRDRLDWT